MAANPALGPPAGVVPAWRNALDRASLLWERTAIYIPVLMMGVLALGTYWLVRNTPASLPPHSTNVTARPQRMCSTA